MTDHDAAYLNYEDTEDTGPPTLEDDAWLTLVLYAAPRKHRKGATPLNGQTCIEDFIVPDFEISGDPDFIVPGDEVADYILRGSVDLHDPT